MLHTIELSSLTTKELYSRLKSLSITKYNSKNNSYVIDHYSSIGFNRITFSTIVKKGYTGFYILIKLNPSQLIGNNNKLGLFEEVDYTALNDKFNEQILKLDSELPLLNDWKLKRVDYCTDIKTDYVKEYIELFKRGNIPYRLEVPVDVDTHKRTLRKGCIYYRCSSYRINIYDKQNELLTHSLKYSTEQDILDAQNILRVEVQCYKDRTNNIKSKYNLTAKSLFEYINLTIYQETINKAYKDTIGTGDYYKLNKAIALINNTTYYKSHKNNLIEILQLVNKHRSVCVAKEQYTGIRDFNKCLNDLNIELGINSVTIPRRWKLDFLVNPFCDLQCAMLEKR